MTNRLLLLFSTIFLLTPISAQETGSDSLPQVKKRRVEIGMNITNTLSSLLGSSSNTLTTDPYLISLRVGTASRRWRMGLSFKVKNTEDGEAGLNFSQTKTSTVHYRMGYEWVNLVSRHFAFYWGLDGVFDAELEDVRIDQFGAKSVLRNRLWGFGLGPVLGVQWRVHPRVILTTESSIYAIVRRGYEDVDAPPDFFTHTPVRDFVWQPLLPSSLYIQFAF